MLVILGATGMLGQALMVEAINRGLQTTGIARTNAAVCLDIGDADTLFRTLECLQPRAVINSAAITDLAVCERESGSAWQVNARAVAVLAEACNVLGTRLVHVSTDHFFTGDGSSRHDESVPVRLLNEYARSKYAGETCALTCPHALVVRTNVTGFRGLTGRPTFAEWLFQAIENDEAITLFDDFYTSTLDSRSLAMAIFDLLDSGENGLINLASQDVSTKKTFAEAAAAALGRPLSKARVGSVRFLTPRRAESLGLDVTRGEIALGRRLPNLEEVVHRLLEDYRKCTMTA